MVKGLVCFGAEPDEDRSAINGVVFEVPNDLKFLFGLKKKNFIEVRNLVNKKKKHTHILRYNNLTIKRMVYAKCKLVPKRD